MSRFIDWIKRKRKALLALGSAYLLLEFGVALVVGFGVYNMT
jgi:hypothetical protein